jgi:hypothetical protein
MNGRVKSRSCGDFGGISENLSLGVIVRSAVFQWKFNRLKKYSLFFQFLLKRICGSVLIARVRQGEDY